MPRWLSAALLALGALVAGIPAAATAPTITSYAIVHDDGTLRIRGRTIHLFGAYIPPHGQTCRTNVLPIRCAPRAALALENKIRGFVRCEVVAENPDGSLDAVCFVAGDSILAPDVDLGAWLIEQGFAVATPEAPFEYAVLERIAQARGLGVWGFQADQLRRRPAPLHRSPQDRAR